MDKNALTNKKKQLIFRCGHRGTKEMDLLLGEFAKRHVPDFNEEQLLLFEDFVKNSDPDIYNWMTGRETIPDQWNNEIAQMVLSFDLHE